MADLGTVQVLTVNPVEITSNAVVGINHGTVQEAFPPIPEPPFTGVPTTGQIWPRSRTTVVAPE